MRPLRLTMTAFGPYAGTEVVDFDALTELGLFVVAGNNGAGKTTIFDALHYSLFGTLPGRRATYIRLKSDHADDTAECKVMLDFAAHGKHWRVERSPKQKRAKRRGTGFTEVDSRATLHRLEADGTATAIASKLGEVSEQCRQLVGLSGKQFERVALLPQGEFSRVLRESSTDRRELLRTLFSSEVFGDATALLTDDAAEATAADRSVFERLDHQQVVVTQAVSTLIGQPVNNTVPELRGAISDFRRVQLNAMTSTADQLETAAQQAASAHQGALDISRRIARRVQVEHDYQTHQATSAQHAVDLERLEQGRAAVPVANLVRATAEQQQRQDTAEHRVNGLHQQLNRALQVAGVAEIQTMNDETLSSHARQLTDLSRQLHERSEAALRVSDLDATTKRSHADLRRVANEMGTLDEHMAIAQSQHRQLNAEQDTLAAGADIDECEQQLRMIEAQLHQRTELENLDTEYRTLVQKSTELETRVGQTQQRHEQASQAHTSLPTLQAKADAAFAAFESCTARRDAAQTFATANARLGTSRDAYRNARDQADQLWDAFIAGTAARVAEALVEDEPCPVCGSAEHPTPATIDTGDNIVSEADVTAARVRVDQLHDEVRVVEAQIETLRSAHEDIASLSPADAAAEITTAKAMALGARTRADDARQAASKRDRLHAELEQTRTDQIALARELQLVDQRCNHLRGALGDQTHESVASLRAQAEQARQARTIAEHRTSRHDELVQALAAAAQDIDTIGLGQIAAEARRSASVTQLEERQNDLDQATAALAALDLHLQNTGVDDSGDPARYEQRAQAARHASELIAELATAGALQHEAADGIRRARSLLDDRINQSPFASTQAAMAAFVEPHIIDQLEAQTTAFVATDERIRGQLQELADLPTTSPDLDALHEHARQAAHAFTEANRNLITITGTLDRLADDLEALVQERETRQTGDLSTRRLERVAALVKGDNDRNTSLENWVLAAHLRDVVELANIRLARSTHQRFQLCVLDDGENKRGKWGLDLGVEDTVTGTRRPTAGLSGGELFQASLALALGLADAVMNQTAGVRIDALFIDEGFGSLDEVSVERAIDLLDELRDRGAMVGVITHVPALLDALPLGVSVIDSPDGNGSTIRQSQLAA